MTIGIRQELRASFDETLARMPEALKSEGFGILTEIDVTDTLRKKLGVAFRRYRILGACNPSLAHQALLTDLAIGTMLPCNVVVYETDGGGSVVHAIDPMETLAAADDRFREVAAKVREKLVRVLERVNA